MTVLAYYAGKLSNLLAALICVCFGIYFFGDNHYFDWVLLFTLILLILLTVHQVNVWTAIAIYLSSLIVDQVLFYFTQSYFLLDMAIYTLIALLLVKSPLKRFKWGLLVLLAVTVLSEGYWQYSDYANKPDLYFYWCYLWVMIITKIGIDTRPLWIDSVFNTDTDFTLLDGDISDVISVYILIDIANIIEYLIRHLTDYKPLLVWSYYSEAKQLTSILMLFVIIRYILRLTSRNQLKA